MPEPRTAAPGSSSLLPTPTVQDGENTAGPSQLHRNSLPLNTLVTLLPTPSANDTTGAEPNSQRTDRNAGGPMLRDLPHLLPTPTVMDMGANYTPEEWEAWKAKQRQAHANGNGHGESLTQAALSTGASTPPPSTDGSASSDDPHQPPPSPDATDDHDSTLFSWNG